MPSPFLMKALGVISELAISIEDKPNGHYTVKVLAIPFFDSERRERRLARRAARRAKREGLEQCNAKADDTKDPG